MPTVALVLSILFAQGHKVGELIRPSHPGVAMVAPATKTRGVVPLTQGEVLAIAARTMPGKAVSRITTITARRLGDIGPFAAFVTGPNIVDGLHNDIVLYLPDSKHSGGKMTVVPQGTIAPGNYLVTLEGSAPLGSQLSYESGSSTDTIDLPDGEFHIPVLMTVGKSAYFTVGALTSKGGVCIQIDAIQIYRIG